MGLDDLIPEGKEDTGSRRRGGRKKKKDTVSFGSGRLKKEFTKERWEEVKHTLTNEMGLVPNEVVNNYSAQERFETLHEAAMLSQKEITQDDLRETPTKCRICGNAVGESGVKIAGMTVCIHHTVGQVQAELE